MITITPRALTVIRRVTTHPSMKSTAGVRIACREDAKAPLQVRAVETPRVGDRVLERAGGRLYLESNAARRVEGRELDAVIEPDGRVQFIMRAAA